MKIFSTILVSFLLISTGFCSQNQQKVYCYGAKAVQPPKNAKCGKRCPPGSTADERELEIRKRMVELQKKRK